MSEIVALAIGEDTHKQSTLDNFFKERGYACIDEVNGIYQNSDIDESFKCAVYEKTGYMVFQETENQLPNEVFDYILTLPYENALVSLGTDDGYSTTVYAEMNLNKFKKDFKDAQEEDE